MNAEELKELEQFADKLRQIPPITDFIQAVNLMAIEMYNCVKQRDERIAALTEELRGIERILDDPRIHNTHTIEEVLHEKLAGLNKFERI